MTWALPLLWHWPPKWLVHFINKPVRSSSSFRDMLSSENLYINSSWLAKIPLSNVSASASHDLSWLVNPLCVAFRRYVCACMLHARARVVPSASANTESIIINFIKKYLFLHCRLSTFHVLVCRISKERVFNICTLSFSHFPFGRLCFIGGFSKGDFPLCLYPPLTRRDFQPCLA